MHNRTCRGNLPRGVGARCVRYTIALILALVSPTLALAKDDIPSPITALAFDPTSQALLKSDDTGLYRSFDSGRSWEAITVPSGWDATSIVVTFGKDGAIYAAGPGLGIVHASRQGGAWTTADTGLPSRDVSALAAHSTQPRTLYAYVPESGIYRTRDAGASWKLMDRGPDGIRQLIHTNMEGSMETGWLYAATAAGVRFSMDCFCLWRQPVGVSGSISALAVDPAQPQQLYASSSEGLFVSTNGGQAWESAGSPLETVTALIVVPPGVLYAGTINGHLFRSADAAESWELVDD